MNTILSVLHSKSYNNSIPFLHYFKSPSTGDRARYVDSVALGVVFYSCGSAKHGDLWLWFTGSNRIESIATRRHRINRLINQEVSRCFGDGFAAINTHTLWYVQKAFQPKRPAINLLGSSELKEINFAGDTSSTSSVNAKFAVQTDETALNTHDCACPQHISPSPQRSREKVLSFTIILRAAYYPSFLM